MKRSSWVAAMAALVGAVLLAGSAPAVAAEATWRSHVAVAGKAYGRGEYRAAEHELLAALAAVQKRHPDGPEIAAVTNNLAIVYQTMGRLDEAEPLLRRTVEVWRRTLGPDHANLARSLNNLAELYQVKGADDRSEATYEQALAIAEKNARSHPQVLRNVLDNYARLLADLGRAAEAEALSARSKTIIYLENN